MSETPENRLKRLHIRSWRRGTKEMDLILGPFFEAKGSELDAATLDLYESLLSENDQDLYQWITGRAPRPAEHEEIIATLQNFLEKSD